MNIDAHNHFWKFDPVRHDWITGEMAAIKKDFSPDDLLPLLRSNNIGGTVAVQVDQTEDETRYLLELADQFSFIKGVVGWVDLRASDLKERLEYFSQFRKLKGFRHIVQGESSGFLKNRLFINGVKLLGEFGYTYDLLIYHYQLKEALEFVAALPNVKIVVDHIAKPSIRTNEKVIWDVQMAELAKFQNVHCKISGMVTEANWNNWKKEDFFPYLDEIFGSFGTSRLLYGSDWPVCLVAATYDQQISIVRDYISSFSSEEQSGVMGINASKFYDLE
jgi:L-fuconolactonase